MRRRVVPYNTTRKTVSTMSINMPRVEFSSWTISDLPLGIIHSETSRDRTSHAPRGSVIPHKKSYMDSAGLISYDTNCYDTETFEKRPGTSNKGKEYEDVIVAKIILDLLMNNNIDDFHISSNDKAFGAFDDVIVEVRGHNGDNCKFALQLKHSNKGKNLILSDFSEKSNFFIIKYFKSFQTCKKTVSKFKWILSTTYKLDFSTKNRQFPLTDDETFQVEIFEYAEPLQFLNISSESSRCYKFQIVKNTTISPFTEKMKEYEEFFAVFFLYTDQKGVDQIKSDVSRTLEKETGCDEAIFLKYIAFISEWSMRDGTKEMLNKRIIAKFLTLCLLSPSMHPYAIGDSVGESAEILQKAIGRFIVTVFGKTSLEGVRRLWGNAKEKLKIMDIKQVNRIRRLYVTNWHCVNDLNELSDNDCTKLMWYIDEECPLIVEESSLLNYKAISLCRDKKYVIIRSETSSIPSDEYITWEKLSDLRVHSEVFKELTEKFKCQLPGWEVSLKDLIAKNEKFLEIITTDELIKMVEGPYVVYKEAKEELPEPYVTRFLSGNFIELKYLETVEKDTFIVLSNVHQEDVSNYSKRKNFHVMKERCDAEKFKKICEEHRDMKCFYHFLMIDGGTLQLIRNKGDISNLQKFPVGSIEEAAFHNPHNQYNINIVTCEPGMGKSVLLRKLKNNLSAKIYTLILTPTDISAICKALGEGEERNQIEDLILKNPSYNQFEKSISTLLMQMGKICYLWDALDEMIDENFKIIIDFILEFSRTNCIQWITCRRHLKERLEEKFNVLSTSIAPFDDQQQRHYIQIRLEPIGLDSDKNIIETIVRNITFAANTNILGIPLQIFMLTELFRQDENKAKNLMTDKIFSLSDLYEHFINGKFAIGYKKAGIKIFKNDSSRRKFESDKRNEIRKYQQIALKMLFDEEDLTQLNICQAPDEFLTVEENGLFIKNDEETYTVAHISYAEYFAASYFAKHYKENLVLENFDFDARYDNVRFFFDCLLAQDSLPHIAVLCKNLELLKQYQNELGDCKDSAGRNLLHLAASWGERYELFEVEKSDEETIIINADVYIMNESTKSEMEMLEYLLKNCDVDQVDDLFKLNCLEYAEKFECLLNLVFIENSKKTGYFNSKTEDIMYNILFHSTYLGLDGIIENYKEHKDCLQMKTKDFQTLLHIASLNGHVGVVQLLIDFGANKEAKDCNLRTPIHYASLAGQHEVAQKLINSEANIEAVDKNHETPLHYAAGEGQLEIVKLLIDYGANILAVNCNGFTPLQFASKEGHLEIARLLINSGANIEAIGDHNETPLHHASQQGQLETAQFLINAGANKEAKDCNLCTPLHYASVAGQHEVAQKLINSEANIEAVDKNHETPLHYAAGEGQIEIVQLLIDSGANIQAVNCNGFTPLQFASKEGHLEIAQLLTKSGLLSNR